MACWFSYVSRLDVSDITTHLRPHASVFLTADITDQAEIATPVATTNGVMAASIHNQY